MDTMKAVVCTKYGPPEVLKIAQYKKPMPREDELLIQICATSVTNSDLFIRSSKVPLRVLLPFRLMIGIRKPRKEIIGEVFAGIVAAVGSKITRFHVGDQVDGQTRGLGKGKIFGCGKILKEIDCLYGLVQRTQRLANLNRQTVADILNGDAIAQT